MKRAVAILSVILFWNSAVKSQTVPEIEVSFDKKVILLFEHEIEGYEIGDSETIGCIAEDKRLMMQSPSDYGEGEFYETNLLVWTKAGYYFSFLVDYKNDTPKLFHVIKNENATYAEASVSDGLSAKDVGSRLTVDQGTLSIDSICAILVSKKDYLYSVGSLNNKMELVVGGIYVDDKNTYIETWLYNSGDVRYDIEVISFFIHGKGAKKRKRTAVSKQGTNPNYTYNSDITSIEGGSGLSHVFVFDRFTIDQNKELRVGFYELNGDRDMEAVIRAKETVGAKSVKSVIESEF